MITKKDFIRYINYIQKEQQFLDEVGQIYRKYDGVIAYAEEPIIISSEHLIDCIERSLGIKSDENQNYTTLSWWIWECGFGEKFKVGDLINDNLQPNDPMYSPDLSTVDKLWEYLLWEAETFHIA